MLSEEESYSALVSKLNRDLNDLQAGISNLLAFWRRWDFHTILVFALMAIGFGLAIVYGLDFTTLASLALTIALVTILVQLGSNAYLLETKLQELNRKYLLLSRAEESRFSMRRQVLRRIGPLAPSAVNIPEDELPTAVTGDQR